MKKFKSYKVLCLTLGLGVALSGTIVNAANITKTLKAVYSNIAISYNGQNKLLSSEPFLVDGVTYVPLRAVSEIMGANVSWANNTVYITNQTTPTVSNQQEIAAKNFEIASLKQQLDVAKRELETYKGTGIGGGDLTTASINTTLNKIVSTYSDDFDIDWTIDLKQVSGRLELTVSYNSRSDSAKFDRLTTTKRKQFIKEICYDISMIHKDIEIRGTLEESRNDKEVATFRYTKTGSYTYEEKSFLSVSDLSRELERYYTTIDVTTPSIPVDNIELTERNGVVTASIYVNLPTASTYRTAWNNINKLDLRDYLDKIADDIEEEYGSSNSIALLIRDTSPGSPGIIGRYENGRVTVYERRD